MLGLFYLYRNVFYLGNEAIAFLEPKKRQSGTGSNKSEQDTRKRGASLVLLEQLITRAPAQFSKHLERTAKLLEVWSFSYIEIFSYFY
jgi:hypothetical protein